MIFLHDPIGFSALGSFTKVEHKGGMILGPSLFGHNKTFMDAVFPLRGEVVIETMSNVGILYFIFLVGVGMDTTSLRRIGKKSVTIALASMVLPFALGALFSLFLIDSSEDQINKKAYIIFIGVVLSITAFPVVARILVEVKLINTEIGKLALSAALVNDLLSWVLVTIAVSMVENEKPTLTPLMVFSSAAAFVAFNFLAVRPLIMWLIRNTPEGESFSDCYICIILAGVMLSGFITEAIGTHSILGAFVFGLTIPNGPLGIALVERLEDFVSIVLLPLFFATSGFKTNLRLLNHVYAWLLLILLVILSSIGKIIGTIAVAYYYQMSVREGAAVGLLLNTKGLLEVIVLNIGQQQKVLTQQSFASMVVITVLMTGTVVPGILALYRPTRGFTSYTKRTIQMTKRDAEFRILVCVHTPRNVPTIINLLEASNPTKNSPIWIYVVHLVELTGRTSALLIVHNSRKSDHAAFNRTHAQTQHIINAFENYELQADHISVQPLTAMSPYSTMHDDICNLALDKRVAFIIIPFHKQRTIDGGMEVTNIKFRNVNRNVLANAPCSVGILVDRGLSGSNYSGNKISHSVVVLFFGGPDDREALSYGWRMSEHPGVNLTVMRFMPGKEAMHHGDHKHELTVDTDEDVEKQLDNKLIHWFRTNHVGDGSVVYVEKVVNNGEETVAAMRTIDNVHDLFIIGRAQGMVSPLTAELTHWSECPELGAIGDLLAASDFVANASVLIVQQYVGAGLEGDGLGAPPNNTGLTNEEFVKQISIHSTPEREHNNIT